MVNISNTPNQEGKQVIRIDFRTTPDKIEIECDDIEESRYLFANLSRELGLMVPPEYQKYLHVNVAHSDQPLSDGT